MARLKSTRLIIKTVLFLLCDGLALVSFSAHATVVTWNLNPNNLNQPVGSSTRSYTVSGYTISAYGYDNNNGDGTLHHLFYKNAGADEFGLGLVNTPNNELQVNEWGTPLQFIQLNLSSILSQGLTNGRIEIGSVQSGESFNLYGSTVLGQLGTRLNSMPYGSNYDLQFVSIPSFGSYRFISVVAAVGDSLPVAFQATIAPIPEAASLIPAALLAIAATIFEARRRRRSKASK
jgi:hypothetical protein